MATTWNRLMQAPSEWQTRTRDRLHGVRTDSVERLRTLRAQALERADGWVDRADGWRIAKPLASVAGRLLDRSRARWGVVPVAGWDELNAKDAIRAIGELDRVGLLQAARRREEATKARRTVLTAIDDRIARLTEN